MHDEFRTLSNNEIHTIHGGYWVIPAFAVMGTALGMTLGVGGYAIYEFVKKRGRRRRR